MVLRFWEDEEILNPFHDELKKNRIFGLQGGAWRRKIQIFRKLDEAITFKTAHCVPIDAVSGGVYWQPSQSHVA